jgi:type IV pilus assembly protein PilE
MKQANSTGNFTVRAIYRSAGMTLIEIILVVGLLALLLSLAMPTYQGYLLRGHRVEAIRLLLTAAACQERHRARKGAFDTTRCAGNSGNEFYRLIIEPEDQSSSTEFLLIADPLKRQQHDICGRLSLDQSGTRGISGPQDKLHKCWAGR